MILRKSLYTLKIPNRVFARLTLTLERNIAKKLIPVIGPIYILFFLADCAAVSKWDIESISFFVGIRAIAFLSSWAAFDLTRGRLKYRNRNLLVLLPYMFVIQAIVIKFNLSFSPYFSAFALVMFAGSLLLPMSAKHAIVNNIFSIIPISTYYFLQFYNGNYENFLSLVMVFGTAILTTASGDQAFNDLLQITKMDEEKNIDLRERSEIIKNKVDEITKRKEFEKQFSPQVIETMLSDKNVYKTMKKQNLVTVVFDIVDSTKKASSLDPINYKDAVEEVYDIITSACYHNGLTIDKFTGDGAQVFAGSPEPHHDDLERAIKASTYVVKTLESKKNFFIEKWGESLQLKVGICHGEALVGFLGRGFMKSFTAIGVNISLAHRICAEAKNGHIIIFDRTTEASNMCYHFSDYDTETITLPSLKGIKENNLKVLSLRIHNTEENTLDLGRCEECETPHILTEDNRGMPKVICPICDKPKSEGLEIKKAA